MYKEDFDKIVQLDANAVTRENANINSDTPSGMMMKFASITAKKYAQDNLLSPVVR
jgi:ribonucleoside-triphosphate reductase